MSSSETGALQRSGTFFITKYSRRMHSFMHMIRKVDFKTHPGIVVITEEVEGESKCGEGYEGNRESWFDYM
jgi:hypothetical protein